MQLKRTVFGIMLIAFLTATLILRVGLLKVESSSVPGEPHNANAIWIEPSTILPPNLGERFNITVWTNMSEPTIAWIAKMYWNKTYLNLTRIDYTGAGKSQFFTGLTTLSITPTIDYISGSVVIGESAFPPGISRAAGYGSLFWAEFEVIAHPVENVSDALNINNPDTYILDTNSAIIPTSKYNADLSNIIAPDIAVTSVEPSLPSIGQGLCLPINVTVENQGFEQESFTITVFARSGVDMLIQAQNVTLQPQSAVELMFIWDTANFTKGNYTIIAAADTLPGEVDTADNEFTDGWVLVTMTGDITGPDKWPDGKVDMRDVGLVASRFGDTDP